MQSQKLITGMIFLNLKNSMEKIFKAIKITILVSGAGMIVYPLLVNFLAHLDNNLPFAIFSLLPLVTFFWLTSQVNELEKSKKIITELRSYIKHN